MLHFLLPKGSTSYSIATNTLSQLLGRVVSTVMMTIISLLIARRFGADGYGDFVKITTYVGFFYLFADFGLNAVFIQDTSGNVKRIPETQRWRELFGLRFAMGVVLMIIAVSLLSVLPSGIRQGYTPLVRYGIFLLLPVIIAQAMTTTTNAFFQKILRYDLSMIAQNAGSVVMVTVALFLTATSAINGALAGVYAVFAGSIITALLALRFVRSFGAISPHFHVKMMNRYLLRALPLGLTLMFNMVYFHADSIVLTLFRTTNEVGIYGLAYKVFELPLVFPVFFMNSVFPVLVAKTKTGQTKSHPMFWRSLFFLVAVSVIVTAGLWIVAPVVALVRTEFSQSIQPLRVLILSLPVFFASSLFMWMLIAQKLQWQMLTIHGVSMTINIVFNMLYIPQYGYMAAAWITVASESLVLLLSAVLVFRTMYVHARGVQYIPGSSTI